jgi:pimeloyl-ACP methyl ester carboxylesterase
MIPTDDTASGTVRQFGLRYRAHNGLPRPAVLLLPSEYGPENPPPPLPLVISPHGRGIRAITNAEWWRDLPARGGFAVVCPGGMGRRLPLHSWGWRGQISDLARMPSILRATMPWLRVDLRRIYAVGGSMGGQETLLLLARHPGLLAGAAAFDSVTNMALRYRNFLRVPCNAGCRRTWNGSIGRSLQSLARQEVGGTPATRPLAYSERSPATYARTIAASCVPLQLWWSVKDRIVADQQRQSAALFRRIAELNPGAPVTAFVGAWNHSAEMQAGTRLPAALVAFGLLPDGAKVRTSGLHVIAPEQVSDCVR